VLKLSRRILCIEWDRRFLRVLIARTGGGRMQLEDAHAHRLPAGLDPEDPKALGEFIGPLVRRYGKFERVVLNIPREKAVMPRLALPPTPANELAAAVRFQAMKELPYPLDTAVIDFAVMQRENGLATEVLLASVTNETIAQMQATCAAAGLVPARIGLRPFANLRSVQHLPEARDKRVLFVDVGPATTEINVMRGEQLAFARAANVSVPIATDERPARDDSRILSLVDPNALDAADEAARGAIDDLLVEITRTMQAYRAVEPQATIEQIVVAGGTGLEGELAEALDQRFGLPVALFDVRDVLGVDAERAARLRSFSALLGLAWELADGATLEIDFLNPKRPIEARATLKRRAAIIGAAAAFVLLVGGIIVGVRYYSLSQRLDAVNAEIYRLREQVREKLAIENRVETVKDWGRDASWPDVLLALTDNAVDPGKKMVVSQVSMESKGGFVNLRKILATDINVPSQFVQNLNNVRVNGEQVYRATLGNWQDMPATAHSKYAGSTDVTVNLLDLQKHQGSVKKREDDRKRKLREL
jgi:type IV pilus assembly protein PilM